MLATGRDAKTVLWDVITAVTSTLGPTAMFVGPASGATLLPSLLTLPSAALAPSTLLLPCARLLFTSLGGAIDSWLAAGAVAAAADPAPGVGAALAAGAGEVVSAGSAMAEGDAALHHAKSPILLWHVHVDGQAGKFDWD